MTCSAHLAKEGVAFQLQLAYKRENNKAAFIWTQNIFLNRKKKKDSTKLAWLYFHPALLLQALLYLFQVWSTREQIYVLSTVEIKVMILEHKLASDLAPGNVEKDEHLCEYCCWESFQKK